MKRFPFLNISGPDLGLMGEKNLSYVPCSRKNTENHIVSLTFGNITVSYP